MESSPSTNGHNGRQPNGRFAVGNAGGPGNPHARRVAELRSMALGETSDAEFRGIWRKLLKMAEGGNLAAIREFFDRTLGKPDAVGTEPAGLPPHPLPKDELFRRVHERLRELQQQQSGSPSTGHEK